MSSYTFFKQADIEQSRSTVPETLVLKGGSVEAVKGLLVDGKLSNMTIDSKDGSHIIISALAVLEDCVINGTDVMIEGQFSGTINAAGKTEFASGCVAVGVFNKGGEVYIHKLADLDDLKVTTVKNLKKPTEQSAPQLVQVQTGTNGY